MSAHDRGRPTYLPNRGPQLISAPQHHRHRHNQVGAHKGGIAQAARDARAGVAARRQRVKMIVLKNPVEADGQAGQAERRQQALGCARRRRLAAAAANSARYASAVAALQPPG